MIVIIRNGIRTYLTRSKKSEVVKNELLSFNNSFFTVLLWFNFENKIAAGLLKKLER